MRRLLFIGGVLAAVAAGAANAGPINVLQDQTPDGSDPGIADAGMLATTEGQLPPLNEDRNYGLTAKQRIYCDIGLYQNPANFGPRHALFKFDVSSWNGYSDLITSATFRFYVCPARSNRPGAYYRAMHLSAFRAGKDWIEGGADGDPALPGEVTWKSQKHAVTEWDVPGASGQTDVNWLTTKTFDIPHSVVNGELRMIEIDVTDFVKAWTTGAENNGMLIWGGWLDPSDTWMNNLNGWHVIMSENTGGETMNNADGTPTTVGMEHRPALIVIPEPVSLLLIGLGLLPVLYRRK